MQRLSQLYRLLCPAILRSSETIRSSFQKRRVLGQVPLSLLSLDVKRWANRALSRLEHFGVRYTCHIKIGIVHRMLLFDTHNNETLNDFTRSCRYIVIVCTSIFQIQSERLTWKANSGFAMIQIWVGDYEFRFRFVTTKGVTCILLSSGNQLHSDLELFFFNLSDYLGRDTVSSIATARKMKRLASLTPA